MLQCNRYPGLDANEIIRLTSAIGQQEPFVGKKYRAAKDCQRPADNVIVGGIYPWIPDVRPAWLHGGTCLSSRATFLPLLL